MVTLTLVANGDGDDNERLRLMADLARVFRMGEELSTKFPESVKTVGTIVENYSECLQSLLDDWRGLDSAS